MTTNTSRIRILTAARGLFFKHGFEKVSTDMLVKEAAVSKATLYRNFANMNDVLKSVAETEVMLFTAGTPPQIRTLCDLQTALREFGISLLGFLNQPDTVQFARLIHEEARDNPEVGRLFYHAAHAKTLESISQIFWHAQEKRLVSDGADASDIAEDFLALLEGLGIIRVQLGVCCFPCDDIEKRVTRAVSTILAAHACGGAAHRD